MVTANQRAENRSETSVTAFANERFVCGVKFLLAPARSVLFLEILMQTMANRY
jgi:hypothetical protein